MISLRRCLWIAELVNTLDNDGNLSCLRLFLPIKIKQIFFKCVLLGGSSSCVAVGHLEHRIYIPRHRIQQFRNRSGRFNSWSFGRSWRLECSPIVQLQSKRDCWEQRRTRLPDCQAAFSADRRYRCGQSCFGRGSQNGGQKSGKSQKRNQPVKGSSYCTGNNVFFTFRKIVWTLSNSILLPGKSFCINLL